MTQREKRKIILDEAEKIITVYVQDSLYGKEKNFIPHLPDGISAAVLQEAFDAVTDPENEMWDAEETGFYFVPDSKQRALICKGGFFANGFTEIGSKLVEMCTKYCQEHFVVTVPDEIFAGFVEEAETDRRKTAEKNQQLAEKMFGPEGVPNAGLLNQIFAFVGEQDLMKLEDVEMVTKFFNTHPNEGYKVLSAMLSMASTVVGSMKQHPQRIVKAVVIPSVGIVSEGDADTEKCGSHSCLFGDYGSRPIDFLNILSSLESKIFPRRP